MPRFLLVSFLRPFLFIDYHCSSFFAFHFSDISSDVTSPHHFIATFIYNIYFLSFLSRRDVTFSPSQVSFFHFSHFRLMMSFSAIFLSACFTISSDIWYRYFLIFDYISLHFHTAGSYFHYYFIIDIDRFHLASSCRFAAVISFIFRPRDARRYAPPSPPAAIFPLRCILASLAIDVFILGLLHKI